MIIEAMTGSICCSTSWPMPVACAAWLATARDRSFEPNRWPRMPLPSAMPCGEKAVLRVLEIFGVLAARHRRHEGADAIGVGGVPLAAPG